MKKITSLFLLLIILFSLLSLKMEIDTNKLATEIATMELETRIKAHENKTHIDWGDVQLYNLDASYTYPIHREPTIETWLENTDCNVITK